MTFDVPEDFCIKFSLILTALGVFLHLLWVEVIGRGYAWQSKYDKRTEENGETKSEIVKLVSRVMLETQSK